MDIEPILKKETTEFKAATPPVDKKFIAPNFLNKNIAIQPPVIGKTKRALGGPKAPQFARRFGMPDEVSTSSISTSSRVC